MKRLLLLLFAYLQTFFIRSCTAVTCYGYGGGAFAGDVICPGSNACCGVNATCESNRLCHNPGDSDSTFVRGPCAVQPYDPNTCAVICLYDEVTGFLPRVTRCQDGSFCCNNDSQCCGNKRGVFLDSTGDIVSSLPSTVIPSSVSTIATTSSSTSSSSAGSTTTITSLPEQTSSAASSVTSASPGASDTSSIVSTGTKIGLGIGIPLGALVLGILIITVWFQRRRIRAVEATAKQAMSSRSERSQMSYDERQRQMQHQHPLSMHEIGTYNSPVLKGNDRFLAELPAR